MKVDMKVEQYKQHFSLTMLFAVVVFSILIISILVAVLVVSIILWTGGFTGLEGSVISVMEIILIMALISLVLGFGIALLSSKVPLKPLNQINIQLNRLASGDYKARLYFGKSISTIPSFVEMSDSFNKMAEELENTEMLRSDFVNNFSHEFKTPIVSIAGFAKLLKREDLSEQQRQEYLDIIEAESMRLSSMATNVLNLTKIENQSILTDVTGYNLSEQLRTCVLLLENKWAEKNLELEMDIGEYAVEANEELLKQVWINLLDNAIKFSPQGHSVCVQIREEAEYLAVSVSNTGSQIPEESLKKIWYKFYQADESHASYGNGVGLAIVKRVVELHRGSVDAQNQENRVVFTVTLPKEQ